MSHLDGTAFSDGAFVPLGEAHVSLVDMGFSRSDAVYDTVHVWRGSFFRLDDHLERFERSIASMRYAIPYGREEIAAILHGCVARANLQDAFVQMIVTRGIPSAEAPRDPRRAANRFHAYARPFVWILPEARQQAGMHAVIASIERIRAQAVDPRIKNFHWIDLVRGLFEAYDRGGETAVLVDADGNVLEGPGYNLFVVVDGHVATPATGVLDGITRRTALALLSERGLDVAERAVHADELRNADEAFATSTAGGIMAITTVDGRTLGRGAIGPIGAQLLDDYWAAHARPEWATPVRYEVG